jgi:hypothetical protein
MEDKNESEEQIDENEKPKIEFKQPARRGRFGKYLMKTFGSSL